MGHKTDRRERRQRSERREARADFRRKLLGSGDEVRALYARCRANLRHAIKRRISSAHAATPDHDVARAVVSLLTHPYNGLKASALDISERNGRPAHFKIVIISFPP